MPQKPNDTVMKAASKNMDPKQVMTAVLNETPELRSSVLAAGLAKAGKDGTIAALPDDTRSLHDLGTFIMDLDVRRNAYLNALINRIGMVIVTSKMWNNPWSRFKRGKLEMGETVEEIFVNIAKPHRFDPSGAEGTFMRREIPDVRAAFHSMNFQKFYKVTISDDQLRQSFLSWNGVTELIAKIVESLYTSMYLDEFLTMKYMMAREALNGGMYAVTVADITADADDSVQKFRDYTNRLTFLKSDYNRARVRNSTEVPKQVIFVPSKVESTIGVKVLADAFNLSQVDYLGQRVLVDTWEFEGDDLARLGELFEEDGEYQEFTSEEKKKLAAIVAMKVDENWFMIFDNLERTTENYNGEGLYWNHWLHTWKTFSVSPFANAVVFTTDTNTITGVTVSPSTANVTQGADMIFVAKVNGTGIFDQSVSFSVSGATKSGTTIDPYSGRLHVAVDEPAQTKLTVVAKAVDGKSGSANVTVTAMA